MASFTNTWNAAFEALPADTENVSLGAGRIRDLKEAISERLEIDHSWAGDGSDGEHKKLTFSQQSDPTTESGKAYIWLDTSDNLQYQLHGGSKIRLNTDGYKLRKVRQISANETFSPTDSDVSALLVFATGGGGGSGGLSGTASNGGAASGGGGGGGTAIAWIPGIDGSSYTATVTIGAGGAAGAASNDDGGTGGTTSFDDGTINVQATGGTGGSWCTASTTIFIAPGGQGGDGSVSGPGAEVVAQMDGDGANNAFAFGSSVSSNGLASGSGGGGTYWIGKSRDPGRTTAGSSGGTAGASNTGQGGQGRANCDGAGSTNGAAGGSGIVVVWEFV